MKGRSQELEGGWGRTGRRGREGRRGSKEGESMVGRVGWLSTSSSTRPFGGHPGVA